MITTPVPPHLVRGAVDTEPTDRGLRLHRLPAWARRRFPDPRLLDMQGQPSGVRLVTSTTASTVELVTRSTRLTYRGVDRPRGCIDVFVDGSQAARDLLDGGDLVVIDPATGATARHAGPVHTTRVHGLPAGRHRVEFWLAHNENVELVELRSDAPLEAAPADGPRWVHHGSSISQGSNALAPSETWPAIAARRAGVELCNLGFGGNAVVDPFVARTIRDLPADVISLKLGINVVNADAMRLRAFVPAVHGFLDTIRDGHPDTPIVLVSPVFCGIHEHTSGPGAIDPEALAAGALRFVATGPPEDPTSGRLTLAIVREHLRGVVERRDDDPALHYLDGTALYGPADADELPLPDALHPGPDAHRRIGERFAAHAFTAAGPFPHVAASRPLLGVPGGSP